VNKFAGAYIFLVITAMALVVRLPSVGEFMTADEGAWMLRSGEFWHKLVRLQDPGGTYLTTHPGATTMWLSGAGIYLQEQFQEVRIDQSNLSLFRSAATVPIAVTTAVLIGIIAVWSRHIFGLVGAVGAGVVLATSPYLSGLSMIAHLDALQSLFMLASLIAFLVYFRLRMWRWLVAAGALMGLALATKMVIAAWLPFMFAIIAVGEAWLGSRLKWRQVVRILGFIGGVAGLALFVAWPALWVKTDLAAYIERDVGRVVTQEHTPLAVSREPIAPISFYMRTVMGRVPVHSQLLFLAAVSLAYMQVRNRKHDSRETVWLVLYVVGFLVALSFAAKKADRYALPAMVVISVCAGWLGAGGIHSAARRLRLSKLAARMGMLLLVTLLVVAPLLLSPHASAYTTALGVRVLPRPQQGWGEGLEEAAAWLNRHPLAAQLRVASWYPSVLGTYFDGETFSLSSRHDDRVSFVVTYRNMEGRAQDDIASNVLDEIADREPVHTVQINGIPYAWIYQTDSLVLYDRHVGELVGDVVVGQSVVPQSETLRAVDIGFATFSSRANNRDVTLSIRDANSNEFLRSVTINASEIEDRAWHRFEFDPVQDVEGRELLVLVTSTDSVAGNAVTVLYANADIVPGYLLKGARGGQDSDESKVRASLGADLAYRLVP